MKIIFIIQNPTFNLFESFYNEIKQDKFFDVQFILIPCENKNYVFNNIEELANYFDERNIPYVMGYNSCSKEYIDIESFSPDLVIYQILYDDYRQSELFHSTHVAQYARIAHISYGLNMIKHTGLYKGLLEKNPFTKVMWKIFVENQCIEKEINKKMPEKAKAIGYLKCEKYLHTYEDFSKRWSLSREKSFRIVWKPRWTGTSESSNFLKYLDYFITLVKTDSNIDFVFYSHPLLEWQMVENTKIMKRHSYNMLIKELLCLKNFRIEDSGDFLDTIMTADLYIGDFSSTIAEFFLTGRPIIYTPVKSPLNKIGKMMQQGMYTANNKEELHGYIMNIKNKNDPLSSIRKDIKNIVSLPVQNNQFARYLVDYLKGNPPQKQSMASSS
ncbi:hypothetical protein BA173_03165 [Rickettsia sp. MEAM1 (Bemisia tabaci)]|uniref:hypothetical protein n=1 Tax=unclassified Rickettsia TaxID=114295 RepID=UPI0002FEA2F0|nr:MULTISPECIES: hypothetical protein [unclassified Rickettsia]ASX27860.1 hypothetical protein BA173_03165 [Rickettsia sp. MEAM1 (Bemisia tabaci)]ODA37110.1 hypothetical protein A8V33_03185 [Rickettsia sp. wb]ODA37708.1 hypothetical protein A8V34_04935 [Rickettsia sp. wq]